MVYLLMAPRMRIESLMRWFMALLLVGCAWQAVAQQGAAAASGLEDGEAVAVANVEAFHAALVAALQEPDHAH